MNGHPVITLVVGQAISGGFLTHGYQANRVLAFDDKGVVIHAMHKEAAARITLRTVADLERLAHEIAPMSYDICDFAKLGLLYKVLHVENPDRPAPATIAQVQRELIGAIIDARAGSTDLSNRLDSEGAHQMRKAGRSARAYLQAQWTKPEGPRDANGSCRRAGSNFCRHSAWLLRGTLAQDGQSKRANAHYVRDELRGAGGALPCNCGHAAGGVAQGGGLRHCADPRLRRSVRGRLPLVPFGGGSIPIREFGRGVDRELPKRGGGRTAVVRLGLRFEVHGHRGSLARNRLDHGIANYPGNT